jgi:hypothetical protein
VIPPDYRRLVLRSNGNVPPTLLVDGFGAGVWRPVEGGIQATAFYRLSDEAWTGLEAEAGALVAFLGARWPSTAAATASLVLAKATKNPSPSVLTSHPRCSEKAAAATVGAQPRGCGSGPRGAEAAGWSPRCR